MQQKKSVCIVTSQYLPHVGGVENYVDNLSRELAKRGHEITILTSEIENVPSYEKKEGIEIYRLPTKQFMGGRFPVLKQNRALRQFTKQFRTRRFDVMLVNMRFYFISLYAVRLAKKMGVRCIMLDHGSSHLNTGGKLTTKLSEWFEHGITFLEKRYCREFAGVSKASLEWIQHFGIHSDLLLPNAVDVEAFERYIGESTCDFRKKYGIPKDDIVISFVGRLTLEKGIDRLVNAVKRIDKERRDVWLLAAGNGYLLEKLTPVKSERTHFVGQIGSAEVAALLSQSDIFCLPSFSEGFPTCVLEAGVCRSFVITTYRGDAKEIVLNPDYGIILPDNAEDGLYEAIKSVLDRPEYRARATELCYERIVQNYTWRHTADRFLSWLD
ncbi:MAG: glycosyltransferase family 4 protein [Ruminococcaceae bacterium]|nr:glycosyltransferase family 4 protein [Oscillospiraceae bacterium]